jgi:parallel beta-helix repeat protein
MSRQQRWPARLAVEVLEGRCLPSTFTVTNLLDDGSAGCLRSKIEAANLHPGADTVVFKPGLEGTIRLNSKVMHITEDLTLLGPGAAKVALDAHGASGIFDVDGPGTLKVKIQGLELRNGRAGGEGGGAIFSTETLTLDRVVLTGNFADVGAAVDELGDLTLRRCTISANTAGVIGGGVYFHGDSLTVVQSTISGNTTGLHGGGLYLYGGTAAISHSVIAGNQAGSYGGGLLASGLVADLTIADSTISGNRAGSQGGGLFTLAPSSTLKRTQVTYNTAGSSGGGLLARGPTVVDRCTVSGNTSLNGRGGGIRQGPGALTLTNSTISGNHADQSQGGGIAIVDADPSRVVGCTITGNSAGAGGGVWSENNGLVVEGSVISGNTAMTGDGGGIGKASSALLMDTSTVSGNHADNGFGGGISFDSGDAGSTITACTMSGNTAKFGGGLSLADCSVTLRNSTISGNQAGWSGGGIAVSNSSLTVSNSTIAFNRAGTDPSAMLTGGGGITASAVTVHLESSIVAGNSAAGGFPDLDAFFEASFSAGHSLIGNTDGAGTLTDLGNNLLGTTGAEVDPLLAPLDFYGGPTQTHPLKKGSPAINQGANPDLLGFDQRGPGHKRRLGFAVDIGAFERQ